MVSLRSLLLVASAALLPATVLASPLHFAEAIRRQDDGYLCGYGTQGLKKPADNDTIYQQEDSTTFEVVYCSGQYFKTSTIDASVWLSFPDSFQSGELLTKDQKPDNKDAPAGYYSYRFNVTIYPNDGDYEEGQHVLSLYETTTGYGNPYNYEISQVTLNFVQPASSK